MKIWDSDPKCQLSNIKLDCSHSYMILQYVSQGLEGEQNILDIISKILKT